MISRFVGRITPDDGEVLFVHYSAIVTAEEYRALEEGQRVCFVWRGSQVAHGRHSAEEVRVIGQRQPDPEDEPGERDACADDWWPAPLPLRGRCSA